MTREWFETADTHFAFFINSIHVSKILNLECRTLRDQYHVFHFCQHTDFTRNTMSQQAVRIGKTRTKSNGTRTAFKITFYGFDCSFVRIGCLVRQDQLQIVILRLFHSAQLRTFIFKIFFLVDLEIGKHFRNIRQGGQQAGRRDQATDLKRYTVHIPFKRRCDGRIGIIRFRTKQTRFGLLYPQTGDIGFR